jgi:hypothetical protein
VGSGGVERGRCCGFVAWGLRLTGWLAFWLGWQDRRYELESNRVEQEAIEGIDTLHLQRPSSVLCGAIDVGRPFDDRMERKYPLLV